MQASDLLSPSGQTIATAAGGLTTLLGGTVAVHYNVQIPTSLVVSGPVAVGLICGHFWDVLTRQPVPAPTQGQMTSPPEPKP